MAIETKTPAQREELKRRLRIATASLGLLTQNGTVTAAQAVQPDLDLAALKTALTAAGV